MNAPANEEALAAVGELVRADGVVVAIVVVGGATLNLLGIVRRSTRDVDVIARAVPAADGTLHLTRAEPFPPALRDAVRAVARDFGLAPDWMNAEVGMQWSQGLPPWIQDDIEWRVYAGLSVGLVGRRTLIALKLFAAVDGTSRVHLQDLLALRPADAELHESAAWVEGQDAATEFPALVAEVVERVRHHRP